MISYKYSEYSNIHQLVAKSGRRVGLIINKVNGRLQYLALVYSPDSEIYDIHSFYDGQSRIVLVLKPLSISAYIRPLLVMKLNVLTRLNKVKTFFKIGA